MQKSIRQPADKNQNYGTGFTLFEMVVATTLFLVVMVIALAAFINAGNIQQKAESLRAVNDNLNFAIEMMMREIRTGSGYTSISPTEFQFTDAYNKSIRYRLNNNAIEKSIDGGTTFAPITASEVHIDSLNFNVRGQASGDQIQPLVVINIKGTAGARETSKMKLNLEVTVSQRLVDS